MEHLFLGAHSNRQANHGRIPGNRISFCSGNALPKASDQAKQAKQDVAVDRRTVVASQVTLLHLDDDAVFHLDLGIPFVRFGIMRTFHKFHTVTFGRTQTGSEKRNLFAGRDSVLESFLRLEVFAGVHSGSLQVEIARNPAVDLYPLE